MIKVNIIHQSKQIIEFTVTVDPIDHNPHLSLVDIPYQ
jgi:hypothetical protein